MLFRSFFGEIQMKKIFKIVPRYSIVPLLMLAVIHFSAFYVTRPITSGWRHYDFSIAIDQLIPFVPAFIVIYVLAFLQWAFGLYYQVNHGKDVCFKFMAATLISEVICFATFIIVPTALCGDVPQPEVTGTDFFSWLTRFIYSADQPNNLFPSLHCFASWMCFRGIFYIEPEKRNTFYTVFSFIFTLLVFASTVFVKQHVFVDIIGGVVLAEIGILLEKITGAHRVLEALDNKLFKGTPEP